MRNDFIHSNPLFVQKIKRLLQTDDPLNAALAFQLIGSEDIPEELYQDSINTQDKILLCLKHQQKAPLKLVKLLDLSTYKESLNHFLPYLYLMDNLEYLDLAWNKLSSFPVSISSLAKLRILNLNTNLLRTLPPDIVHLQQLSHLNLSNNLLKELPEVLGQLPHLEYLTLTSNQINTIPESIAGLKKLRKVVLWDNPLSKFEIEKMKSLLPQAKIELEINNLH